MGQGSHLTLKRRVMQELEVAVSLALFSSRMAEMAPAMSVALDGLPDALTMTAAAISALVAAHEPAAVASSAASAAQRASQEANVRSTSSCASVLCHGDA